MKTLKKNKKIIFSILIVISFIALLFYYCFMIYRIFAKELFVKQAIEIYEANQSPVFKIKKVLLYSSANAVDNSENKSLKDLDISQYTDIAIYIDNTSYIEELTQENTVKSLRIDNIQISNEPSSGIKSLTYKNPLNFAKFEITDAAKVYNWGDTRYAPIDYNIIYENKNTPDYVNSSFFTDCSDPITLSYLNRNIVSHYSTPDNSNISFNGSLLNQAGIDLNSLATDISFTINITNNLDENFIYNIKLNLDFDEDTMANGYSFQGKEISDGNAYDFFKDI